MSACPKCATGGGNHALDCPVLMKVVESEAARYWQQTYWHPFGFRLPPLSPREFKIPLIRKGVCPACGKHLVASMTAEEMAGKVPTVVHCIDCDAHVLPVWEPEPTPRTVTPRFFTEYVTTFDPGIEMELGPPAFTARRVTYSNALTPGFELTREALEDARREMMRKARIADSHVVQDSLGRPAEGDRSLPDGVLDAGGVQLLANHLDEDRQRDRRLIGAVDGDQHDAVLGDLDLDVSHKPR